MLDVDEAFKNVEMVFSAPEGDGEDKDVTALYVPEELAWNLGADEKEAQYRSLAARRLVRTVFSGEE